MGEDVDYLLLWGHSCIVDENVRGFEVVGVPVVVVEMEEQHTVVGFAVVALLEELGQVAGEQSIVLALQVLQVVVEELLGNGTDCEAVQHLLVGHGFVPD